MSDDARHAVDRWKLDKLRLKNSGEVSGDEESVAWRSESMRVSSWVASALVVFSMTGCGDPYSAKLPQGGVPTPGQAASLSEPLKPADKEIFLRWTARVSKGDRIGGEVTPLTVSHAISNQVLYEAQQAEEEKKVQARLQAQLQKRNEEKDAAERVARDYEIALQHRAAVNAMIRDSVDVQASGWETRSLFDVYGNETARNIVVRLRIENKTKEEVIGVAGWASIADAFGKELGTYVLKIEPRVPASKTIEFEAFMPYDRNDPNHAMIRQSKNIAIRFFLESAVFQSGRRIDGSSVRSTPTPGPASQSRSNKAT